MSISINSNLNQTEAKPEKKSKMKKVRSIIGWILTSLIAVLFLGVASLQIDALIHKKDNYQQNIGFGFGNFIVQTASMEPEYQVGTAIITKRQDPDQIYRTFLSYQAYNRTLDEDSGEDVDGKMEQRMSEIKGYLHDLSLDSFSDKAFAKAEENIATQEQAGKDVTSLKNSLASLKTARADYYHLRSLYRTIDVTFIDAWSGSITPDDASLTYRTPSPKDNQGNIIPLTHRIREIHLREEVEKGKGKYTFITCGINIGEYLSQQNQYQAFQEQHILGTVILNSPSIGKFFRFVASPWGLLILLLIPALYLVISSVLDIFRAFREPKEEVAKQGSETKGSLSSLSEKDQERLKQEMLEEMFKEKENQRK